MKTILSLTIIVFSVQFTLQAQAAKLSGLLFEPINNIALGPNNVDKYFPNQADSYIRAFSELSIQLNAYIDQVDSETKLMLEKKIQNENKIENNNKTLVRAELKLLLLDDKIEEWKSHNNKAKKFHNYFSMKLDSVLCYSFILNGDTIQDQNLSIQIIEGSKKNSLYEFIGESFLEVQSILDKEATFDQAEKLSDGTRIVRKFVHGGYSIVDVDLRKYLQYKRYPERRQGEDRKPNLEFDDLVVVKRIEKSFNSFNFDPRNIDIYKEIKFIPEEDYLEIKFKENGLHFIPDAWFLSGCD